MFPHPDTVYEVRQSQIRDFLAEAQRDRLVRDATAGQAPLHRPRAAVRLAVGSWLVGIGERISGVSLVPEPERDAVAV
jgi:hypothetical protein